MIIVNTATKHKLIVQYRFVIITYYDCSYFKLISNAALTDSDLVNITKTCLLLEMHHYDIKYL